MGCCPFHVSFYASLNYNWTITLTFFSFLSFSKFSRNYLSSMNIRVVTYRAMELKKNWRYFIETVFENTYNFFFFIYIYLNLVLFIPVSRNRYQPIVFIYLFLQSWASKVIIYLNGTSSTIIIITFRIIENYRSNLVIRNRLWLLNFADRRYTRAQEKIESRQLSRWKFNPLPLQPTVLIQFYEIGSTVFPRSPRRHTVRRIYNAPSYFSSKIARTEHPTTPLLHCSLLFESSRAFLLW